MILNLVCRGKDYTTTTTIRALTDAGGGDEDLLLDLAQVLPEFDLHPGRPIATADADGDWRVDVVARRHVEVKQLDATVREELDLEVHLVVCAPCYNTKPQS